MILLLPMKHMVLGHSLSHPIGKGKAKGEKEGAFPRWIRERANEAGYHLTYEVHDAKDYGVPQTRRRVLFIGTRQDLWDKGVRFDLPAPTHTYDYFDEIESRNNNTLFPHQFPDGEPFVNVFEAIGDLTDYSMNSLEKKSRHQHEFGSLYRTDSDTINEWAGYYFAADTFNNIQIPVGYRNRSRDTNPRREHYKYCPRCGKHNLIVRKKCHSCGEVLSAMELEQ